MQRSRKSNFIYLLPILAIAALLGWLGRTTEVPTTIIEAPVELASPANDVTSP